jgi:integrase
MTTAVRSKSATPRKDPVTGRWGFICDVVSPDGLRHQTRRKGFLTKAEAAAALDAVRTSVRSNNYVAPSSLTLREFAEDKWLPAVRADVAPATFSAYSRSLEHYVYPALGALRLSAIGPEDLKRLHAELLVSGRRQGQGGLSIATVRFVATIIGRVLEHAVQWEFLLSNPAKRAGRPSNRGVRLNRPEPWSPEELRTFLAGVGKHRLAPLWEFLAHTGVRRGEALGLVWTDIDLAGQSARITRSLISVDHRAVLTTTKTDKERMIALDSPTCVMLRAHRAAQAAERLLVGAGYRDRGLVFATPSGEAIHPEAISKAFDGQVRRLGLRKVRTHDLRHLFATQAFASGASVRDVQEQLGHSSPMTTLSTYAHTTVGTRRALVDGVAALLDGHG